MLYAINASGSSISLSNSQAASCALAVFPMANQSVFPTVMRLAFTGGRGTVTYCSRSGAKRSTTLATFMLP